MGEILGDVLGLQNVGVELANGGKPSGLICADDSVWLFEFKEHVQRASDIFARVVAPFSVFTSVQGAVARLDVSSSEINTALRRFNHC